MYPLTPTSPVLLCNTGVFMFPDTMAPMPGSYVGVVLSSELPESDRQLFQYHLSQLTDLRHQVRIYNKMASVSHPVYCYGLSLCVLCL